MIASFNRILDEATGAAARANYTSIASMDAPDDYTVVFNLSQPDVPLLAAMASINAAIVPSEMAESGDFSSTAVGTGPFMLESWTPDQMTDTDRQPRLVGRRARTSMASKSASSPTKPRSSPRCAPGRLTSPN